MGLVDKFSAGYWVLIAIAVASQMAMVALVLVLNRRHFGTPRGAVAVPAE